jgi:hypothetical protein
LGEFLVNSKQEEESTGIAKRRGMNRIKNFNHSRVGNFRIYQVRHDIIPERVMRLDQWK